MIRRHVMAKLLVCCFGVSAPIAVDAIGNHAQAQSDWLRWDTPQRRAPQARPQPRYQPQRAPRGYQGGGGINRYCADLELRLAQLGAADRQAQSNLPALRRDYNKARATYRRTVNALEQRGCYEEFFFSRTLRQTRQCIRLDRQAGQARDRVARLEATIRRAQGGGSRGRSQAETQLINELARNRCGQNYVREARRRAPFFSPFWQDQDTYQDRAGELSRQDGPIVATYRTMCVRRCDGYYFPVSFSTTQRYFGKDENICQQKCAAPADLFVYRNPGEEPDQMRSIDGQPYSKMPNAFRYRKEYVKGCSCNAAQYNPNPPAEPSTSASPAQGGPAASDPAPVEKDRAPGSPNSQDERRVDAKPLPAPAPASTETARRVQ